MKNTKKIFIALIAVIFIASLLVPCAALFASSETEICAKKSDYRPDTTVKITGSGFEPENSYTIEVIRPDGSIVKGDGSSAEGSDTLVSDKKGCFKYNYQLEDISEDFNPVGTYYVNVYDEAGNIIAETSFTDGTVRW